MLSRQMRLQIKQPVMSTVTVMVGSEFVGEVYVIARFLLGCEVWVKCGDGLFGWRVLLLLSSCDMVKGEVRKKWDSEMSVREKLSSQAAREVLAALRQIAENQGRQFQAVLDEALRDYIDRQQKERPRRHVMASFATSLDEFDSLYRELVK